MTRKEGSADPNGPHAIVMRSPPAQGGRARPLYCHATTESAEAEAARLAAKDPGATFRVYEAVSLHNVEINNLAKDPPQ